MLYAYSEATVPKVTLIVRKAYGGAYLAMCSKDMGADQVFAWPNAEIAVMGPDGAANIIFKNEIADSDDPIATRANKIQEYKDTVANPYIAAQRGFVDDVLVPSQTRPRLISAFDMLETKRENRPAKKHGNLPV
jgi:acetyl-CoA carboxylase carboxyltransferase component